MAETTTGVRWLRVLLLAGVMVMGGWAGADAAAAQAGRIVGRVTDPIGRPVEGATVVLEPADSAREARTTRSGGTGGFEFAAVPPGEYTLRVEGPGFSPRTTQVTLRPGDLLSVVSRLDRASSRSARRGPALARTP